MMPRLDGFGLLAALRADDDAAPHPGLLLSARAGEEARIEGLAPARTTTWSSRSRARELLARVGALLELDYMRRTGRASIPAPLGAIRDSVQ